MLTLSSTLAIVTVGLVIVVGGILGLRLHAFLALIIAALTVSALTPKTTIEWYNLGKHRIDIFKVQPDRLLLELSPDMVNKPGRRFQLVSRNRGTGEVESIGIVAIAEFTTQKNRDGHDQQFAVASLVVSPGTKTSDLTKLQWKSTYVVSPENVANSRAASRQTVGNRVAISFGGTCVKIGILIALAAIIGKMLLDSGAADKIVRWTLRLIGEKNAPASFVLSGFALSTPVFFDTVFYLMIPLGKATRMRTGKDYLFYVLAIVIGGTMAHSLVPPTPGPLFAAEELGVDVGMMILMGGLIGLACSVFGFLYALVLTRFADLPLRETPDLSLEELENIAQRDEEDLPSIFMAVMPIVLPVLLITGNTVIKAILKGVPSSEISPVMQSLDHFFELFGNKNIAMAISAGLAIVMLVRQMKRDLTELAMALQAALASGGVIILITCAGGSFGAALQQTGIANLFGDVSGASTATILTIAFVVTALVRLAQGSATVAMITGVGVMASFASGAALGFHPVYLAIAIGCGSKMFLWMNDSGFWVIGKMSGMTEWETLKYVTPMTSSMGLFGLLLTILTATIFPLV